MKPQNLTPTLQAIAAAILFGANAPLSKALLSDAPPVLMAGLLYLGCGAAAVFGLALGRLRQTSAGDSGLVRKELPYLFGAVLAGGVAAPIALMYGLSNTPGATASLLLNFESVATSLIAAFFFREKISRRAWAALGLITAGSAVLGWSPTQSWGFSWMAGLVLLACFLWGLDNNLTRQVSSNNPFIITGIKGLGAGSFSLLLGLGLGEAFPAGSTILGALLVGAFCYGVSLALFIRAMRSLGAARAGMYFATAPFAGALFSMLAFRENPAWTFYLAGLGMMGGVILLLGENHQHHHNHLTQEHEHTHTHDEHHNHTHDSDSTQEHSHFHRHDPTTHTHEHTDDPHHEHGHSES